jgi:ferredoxin-type protein NapH
MQPLSKVRGGIPGPAREAEAGKPPSRRAATWPAFYLLGYFLMAGLVLWLVDRQPGQPILLGLIGVSVAGGFVIHARVAPRRKGLGRKLSLAIVGLSLFLGAGVFGRQSFQIEGFFFYVLAGVSGGVVTHYLVAKIAGPLLIGRAWCSWGCWIWMVFDYLPWKLGAARRPGWSRWRLVHVGLSLGLVAFLVFWIRYDHGFEWKRTDGLWWFLGGCALYYSVGVGLAAALKDNRAFCLYLCPVTVFLRAGNRLSLLKVAGSRSVCTQCHACDKICPMHVDVSGFIARGMRVLDPDCTLCQSCIASCQSSSLRLSLGLDVSRHS